MERARLLRRVARGVSHICFYTPPLRLLRLDTYFCEKHMHRKRERNLLLRGRIVSHRTAYFVRASHVRLISCKDAIEEHVP